PARTLRRKDKPRMFYYDTRTLAALPSGARAEQLVDDIRGRHVLTWHPIYVEGADELRGGLTLGVSDARGPRDEADHRARIDAALAQRGEAQVVRALGEAPARRVDDEREVPGARLRET